MIQWQSRALTQVCVMNTYTEPTRHPDFPITEKTDCPIFSAYSYEFVCILYIILIVFSYSAGVQMVNIY